MLWQHSAEKLSCPRDAANDSGTFAICEDRRVARCSTLHAAHSMQRIAALEQLQVTRAEQQAADPLAAGANQHGAHVVEILLAHRSDVRAVLKDTARLRCLREHAHRELVRIEMPWMLHLRVDD